MRVSIRPIYIGGFEKAGISGSTAFYRQDELDRIPIEGKLGQAKRRYGIGRVMTKLAATSETAIALCFLVMNLEKWLAAIFLCLFFKEQKTSFKTAMGALFCFSGCRAVTVAAL